MSGNIAGAGSSLMGGITGASTAGGLAASGANGLLINAGTRLASGQIVGSGVANAGAAAGTTLSATPGLTSAQHIAAKAANWTPAQLKAAEAAATATPAGTTTTGAFTAEQIASAEAAKGGGLLSSVLKNPYTVPMGIQVLGSGAAGIGQAKAQESAEKRQEKAEEEDRKRYNTNISGATYSSRY